MAIIYMVDISAAFVAIRETLGLLKVVNDAKNDHEVRSATSEIQSKLLTLQSECFALGDLVRAHEAEVVALKAKIAEFEDFKTQTEGYVLNQLESGSLVYTKNLVVGDAEVTVHLCPNCHSKRVISILQPLPRASFEIFNQSKCPSCKYVYDTNKAPPVNW
ncbi:hypothetical protein [Citrobacter portucalensis]|uniref:hypothetical protein n=2 Tax=Citrobacter portucalensis TaxID=1639133 RepID=UPI002964C449|nr:hypothetical protein [Citrobacter portucalensis]